MYYDTNTKPPECVFNVLVKMQAAERKAFADYKRVGYLNTM